MSWYGVHPFGNQSHDLLVRRPSEVALTDTGMTLFEAANATHCQVINERFLDRLSTEDVETLVHIWREIGVTYSK